MVCVRLCLLRLPLSVCKMRHVAGIFGVALNEGHFRDLLFEHIPPPVQRNAPKPGTSGAAGSSTSSADLMLMGFPTRLPASTSAVLCACHGTLRHANFQCPRCRARLCDVPTDCPICGIMVVSAPHLARSFHHLFPVKPYSAVYVLFH